MPTLRAMPGGYYRAGARIGTLPAPAPVTDGAVSDDLRRIARGAGILLPATLFGNALALGLDVYLNGVLGNADYGLFNAVRRVLGFLGFAGLLGMENAVIRFVATAADRAAARGVVRRANQLAVGASALLALGLVAGGPWVAARLDPAPATWTVLALGAVSLPLAAWRMVAVSASQGLGVVADRAVVMFVAWPVVQLAASALLAHALGLGAAGAMGAYALSMAAGALLGDALARRRFDGAPVGPPPPASALVGFAWPVWLQGMVMAAYTWADQVLLAGLRSTEEAGWYGPVAALAPLFGVGLGALNGIFAPVIAERHAARDVAGLERLYRTVTRWAVAMALPPVALCLAVPATVLGLWPDGSAEAVVALRVTAAAQLVCTAVGSVNYLLIMAGHQRLTLWNGLPAVALNLGLSLWLVPAWGVTGAAVANGAAMALANLVALAQVRAVLGIHPFDRRLLKPLVAAAVPAGVGLLAVAAGLGPWPAVAVGGAVGGLGFLAALAGLGFDADDRVVIDAVRRRLRR